MKKCEYCDYECHKDATLYSHISSWHGFSEQMGAKQVRTFESGATRDLDDSKIDYEGFLSPLALKAYGEYMHKNRKLADGSLRDSDNWQKGIPKDAYMKSMWRHFFAVWEGHREITEMSRDDLCALLFNVQGLLHETVKEEMGK